jgi:hypothetical protein
MFLYPPLKGRVGAKRQSGVKRRGDFFSLSPFLRGEGRGEGLLSTDSDSRMVPLTRRAKSAATSPRKRGEVKSSRLDLHVFEIAGLVVDADLGL